MREMARAIARGSPTSTRSASVNLLYFLAGPRPRSLMPCPQRKQHVAGGPGRRRSSREQLTGDDEPLDLARPFADRRQLHVAEVFLGRVVLHETVAAVNLHTVVGNSDRDLARVQLCHRRLERRALAALLQIRRAIGQ